MTNINCFWLILSVVFYAVCTDCRKVRIHNPTLDFALLLDESGTVELSNYRYVFAGIREWIRSYYVGQYANEARFAVVGCNDYSHPRLFLSDKVTADEIASKIPDIIPPQQSDSVRECVTIANTVIFTPEHGDRPEAPNVILHITDCSYGSYQLSWRQNITTSITKFLNRPSNNFYATVCFQKNSTNGTLVPINEIGVEFVFMWMGNNTDSLIFYTNVVELRKILDKVLPGIDVDVQDCKYKNESSQCTWNPTNRKCEQTVYPNVIEPPWPPGDGDPCPGNFTVECSSCAGMDTTSQGSDTTSKGLDTTAKGLDTTAKGTDTTVDGRITEDFQGEKDSTTIIILAIAIPILLLLIIAIVIAVICSRGRKKTPVKTVPKKTGRRTGVADRQREENLKGVQADLKENPSSAVASKRQKVNSKLAPSPRSKMPKQSAKSVKQSTKSPVSKPKSKSGKMKPMK